MKRFLYLLPAVALLFAACSDDDDNNNGIGKDGTISLKSSQIVDAPDNDEIDEVRLVINFSRSPYEHTIATAPWDGGFNLQFPETVSASFLDTMEEFIDDDDIYESLQINNRDVKIGWAEIKAYKNNRFVGYIFQGKDSVREEVEVMYIYSEGQVSIKGAFDETFGDYKETYIYDLNLGKSWNTVADRWVEESDYVDRFSVTSSIPSGLSWYFLE